MEVIFRGVPKKDKEYEAVCHDCESILKFKHYEGTVTYDQRDGNYIKVTCPVCDSVVYKYI